ncbi:hypothetical protein NMG60_11008324 [Bertholletia excelsa]
MAPAQPSLSVDPDISLHSSLKATFNMERKSSMTKSSGKVLTSLSNSMDSIIEVEGELDGQIKAAEGYDVVRAADAEDPDATDYSSSFDGTLSGAENCSGLSDAEIESGFYCDDELAFDDFSCMFPARKKKLTSHWRSFIRPLMWRCKWTELKIKEFQSQASKYARELAAYDQRKQLELDHFTIENCGSKSFPKTFQHDGRKAMKRRKRKRVEDTTDITSYMSQHNLFSYHENKRPDPDGTLVVDDFVGNQEQNTFAQDECGISDECAFFESKDGSELEDILHKIELVQSRVQKLKSRLVVVIAENSLKFSSSETLSVLVPCDGQTSSAHSPNFSACNEDMTSLRPLCHLTHLKSEYDIGDLFMPDCADSSYRGHISVPDIIESTVSLLSAADVTMHQPEIENSCEAIMDNVQIHYQAVEAERYTSPLVHDQPEQKHQEQEGTGQEESSNDHPNNPALDSDHLPRTASYQEQSRLTSCLASEIHFPKSKRKRGERKAGSGGWSR